MRVAREPDVRPAPVRVRVVAAQMSEAIAVPEVRVRVAAFHTLSGMEVARDEEAARTVASVLLLTALVIPAVAELVLAFTTAAMDEEAVPIVVLTDVVARLISTFVAREPDVRPAPVRVRVAEIQTSEASVPKDESVRTLEFQTFVGIVSASEVEAVLMVELTEVVTAPVCVLVLALTTAATEDEAV